MEREQIIKALECCITKHHENCCNLGKWHEEWNCMTDIMKNALALIKDQEGTIKSQATFIEKLKTGIEKLDEDKQRLKAEISVKKKLLKRCSVLVETIKADTVRQMQELIFKFYSNPRYQPTKEHPVKHTDVQYMFVIIERTAKEILGEKVCTNCKHFVGCECFDGNVCDLYEEGAK